MGEQMSGQVPGSAGHEVVVSGVGLVCPAAWADELRLETPPLSVVEGVEIVPFPAFPIEEEIANRADQRAMGPTMQAAVFAAGRALSSAGLKGDGERLESTQILTCGRCVERDDRLDGELLDGPPYPEPSQANGALRTKLRPSFFLTQLPNLISANISIVHGVTGCSQTLLGEETGSLEAVNIACDRIRAGDAERCLVGGVFCASGGGLPFALAYGTEDARIARMASVAAFLVLEQEAAARTRGHAPLARCVASQRFDLSASGDCGQAVAQDAWAALSPKGLACVVTASRGDAASRRMEARLLQDHRGPAPIVALADTLGAVFEAAAPAAIALALSRPGRGGGSQQALVLSLGPEGFGSALVLEDAA